MTNLWTVLYFTLGITLTGLMLVLFKRLFRDKLSARWHYLVWLVLLVRAILPENLRLFSTGFALNTLWISGMKRLRAAVELGRNSLLSTPFGMGGGEISLLKKMPFSAWSLTDRLFAVYLAGVAAVLLYDALLYARLRPYGRKSEKRRKNMTFPHRKACVSARESKRRFSAAWCARFWLCRKAWRKRLMKRYFCMKCYI